MHGWFSGYDAFSRSVPFCCWQARDALHHGRFYALRCAPFCCWQAQMLGIMASMIQKQLIIKVVIIPVVAQRLFHMVQAVLRTTEIPQLQFLDKVIDDPAVLVVQVSPGRSHARCVQRQVPRLRSVVTVHQQGCSHPRRGVEVFPWSRLFV